MTTFKKQREDFVCENCGQKVIGNGFTNHCPLCLWSKHVDIFPGDRQEVCGGMMEPQAAIYKNSEWRIIHRCRRCGHEKINKAGNKDNRQKIIELSTKLHSLWSN